MLPSVVALQQCPVQLLTWEEAIHLWWLSVLLLLSPLHLLLLLLRLLQSAKR